MREQRTAINPPRPSFAALPAASGEAPAGAPATARKIATAAGRGALAGIIATIPMSLAMLALHRLLPTAGRWPLPPKQITAQSGEAAGIELEEGSLEAATAITHLGYGGAVGALYGLVGPRLPLPRTPAGILFGVLVWFCSYMGWVPALGLMEPATEQPRGRNIMMIAAHLVWGAVTGRLSAS